MRLEVSMKVLWKLAAAGAVFALAGCASQETVDSESGEPAVVVEDTTLEESAVEETPVAEPVAEPTEESVEEPVAGPTAESAEIVEVEPALLEAEGIAVFEIGSGATVAASESITLATGGAEAGRLIPTSSNSSVTLYLTRDGSIPSAANNWGGPLDPDEPPLITRQLEGTGTYKLVAELDGSYSEVATVYVTWQHEESPALAAPTFVVAGSPMNGSVELSVSDGSHEDLRLYIVSDYGAATLYISRDGTDPTLEIFWKSQLADGTYLFSSEPTAAAYRVIAVWRDAVSPVASLDVVWVE
jgi:hypothetical protein